MKFLSPIDYGRVTLSSIGQDISVLTPVLIDSFDVNTFRSAEYIIQITQDSNFVMTRLLVLQNSADICLSEYATVSTGSAIDYTFDASIHLNSLELTISCPTANTFPLQVKLSKTVFDR
jgi:hypothetical protein